MAKVALWLIGLGILGPVMTSTQGTGSSRGRVRDITPRLTTSEQVVHITPDLVRVGYLLHDGLVTDIDIEYSPETGKPVEYTFDTPHCLVTATPEEIIDVYARVYPEHAEKIGHAYRHRAEARR